MENTQRRFCGKRFGGERPKGYELHRYVKAGLISVLMGEAVTIVMLFLFSLILCQIEVPPFVADGLAVFSAVAGSFSAGYLCGSLLKEKGLLFGVICGGAILFLMMLFSVGFHLTVSLVFLCIKVVLILLGSVLGGVLGVNRRKRIKC